MYSIHGFIYIKNNINVLGWLTVIKVYTIYGLVYIEDRIVG